LSNKKLTSLNKPPPFGSPLVRGQMRWNFSPLIRGVVLSKTSGVCYTKAGQTPTPTGSPLVRGRKRRKFSPLIREVVLPRRIAELGGFTFKEKKYANRFHKPH